MTKSTGKNGKSQTNEKSKVETLGDYLKNTERACYQVSVIDRGKQLFVLETSDVEHWPKTTVKIGNLLAHQDFEEAQKGNGWRSYEIVGTIRLVVWANDNTDHSVADPLQKL